MSPTELVKSTAIVQGVEPVKTRPRATISGTITTSGSRQETLDTYNKVEHKTITEERIIRKLSDDIRFRVSTRKRPNIPKPEESRSRRIYPKPFDTSEFVFIDKEFMSSTYANFAAKKLSKFLNEIPAIINCGSDCFWTNPLDISLSSNSDIEAMLFGLFKSRQIVGGFVLFNTNIVSETARVIELSSSFVPAFDGLGRTAWDRKATRLLDDLLNKPLEQAQSEQIVKIVEWVYPDVIGDTFSRSWSTGGSTGQEYLDTITRPDRRVLEPVEETVPRAAPPTQGRRGS